MSKSNSIQIILSAKSTDLVKGLKNAQRGYKAFNAEVKNGTALISAARNQMLGLAASMASFYGISQVNQMLLDASSAAYNLEASLKAANRQFEVGSADEWTARIERLSEELQIYSNTELKNATARTVDMTKRLGLSSDQMERLISLTGDLSAGKTGLEDGVERVTAALRGEAEASEYLGLTLNETYVKGWYEAQGAMQGAWKDLTDLQKAQVRYQVFLEQASATQGKAAESVETYAGALKLIRKTIDDSITNNEDLVAALKEVARVLRENAGELGDAASKLASFAAEVITFVANNREMIAEVIKWGVVFGAGAKIISTLLTYWQGLNAAMTVMTGMRLAPWFASLGTAATAALGTIAGQAALLAAAFWAAYKAGSALYSLTPHGQEMAQITRDTAEDQGELERITAKVAERFAEISKATGVTVTTMEELDQAVEDGKIHYDELIGDWVAGAKEMAEATKNSANQSAGYQKTATEEMKKAYQGYADQVKKLQDQIAGREQSLAEQLRSMSRSGMDDYSAWQDRKKEAEEYAAAAEKAAAAGDWDEAVKLADKAKTAYADLNEEVKVGDQVMVSQQEALQTAMDGVKSAGEQAISYLEQQKEAAKKAADALDDESWGALSEEFGKVGDAVETVSEKTDEYRKTIVKVGDQWVDTWDDNEKSALDTLKKVKAEIEAIDGTEIEVYVNQITKKRWGGLIHKLAHGGKLSGYGGGDRIQALLEAGEFVNRKESVRYYGSGLFHALNNMQIPKVEMPGFATGGQVGAAAQASGGSGQPVYINFPSGNTVGPFNATRSVIRQIEREKTAMAMGAS